MGTVSVVVGTAEAPAARLPTASVATCDVLPPAEMEMATLIDCAVAVPRLATMSCSPVVPPLVTVVVVRLSPLATMSGLGTAAATVSGVDVVLLPVSVSTSVVPTVAITVYCPGAAGAVSVAFGISEEPAASVPTLSLATCDVTPPPTSETVTPTECAGAVPRFVTATCTAVLPPAVTVVLPSASDVIATSATPDVGVAEVDAVCDELEV